MSESSRTTSNVFIVGSRGAGKTWLVQRVVENVPVQLRPYVRGFLTVNVPNDKASAANTPAKCGKDLMTISNQGEECQRIPLCRRHRIKGTKVGKMWVPY